MIPREREGISKVYFVFLSERGRDWGLRHLRGVYSGREGEKMGMKIAIANETKRKREGMGSSASSWYSSWEGEGNL